MGTVPGQPLSAAGYSQPMRRHGFHTIPARSSTRVVLWSRNGQDNQKWSQT
ncbi:hypothetical protein [Streptomyces sp. NPDC088254]|uniref:hypothetical protein n=1 Tax=Streptomyces sp. NPDC088254 TaxID=3365847 RepID=UPI00382A574F